jgi:intein/homing endonuclease
VKIRTSVVLEKILAAQDKRGIVLEGGSRCFSEDTLVVTSDGSKKISDIQKGNLVLTMNEGTGKEEFKKVLDVLKFQNNEKKAVRIKLKNGKEIICTADHKFYFEGGWLEIKQILHLWNENNSKF